MTADPVQVLVTIHPHGLDFDWVPRVESALRSSLSGIAFECDLVRSWPHGEAKAHREAADRGIAVAEKYGAPSEYVALNSNLAAIAHALLALGERP